MCYFLLKTIWKLISYIPLPILYLFSNGLYYPFYYIVRYRRKVVRKNLSESFPEKNIKEIIKIEKKFYRYFLDIFFETIKLATISKKNLERRMKFINIEIFNNFIAENKSVALFLGHYGNWEWVSSIFLYLDKKVIGGQIYKEIRSKLFGRLMFENRARFGLVNIEMRDTLRWMNEKINNKDITGVGYIADQSPSRKQSKYFINFLNHNVPVHTGTEKLVKRYGNEALYLDIKRIKRGYYEATLIKMHEDPKSLPDFDLTDIYFKYLETSINRQPEIYLWSHKRFKHAKND